MNKQSSFFLSFLVFLLILFGGEVCYLFLSERESAQERVMQKSVVGLAHFSNLNSVIKEQ